MKPQWSAEEYRKYVQTGVLPDNAQTKPSDDPRLTAPSKADIKLEKELQKNCENYLSQRGYHRLSAPEAEAVARHSGHCKGWFGHLAKCKQNPLMPDLFIFDAYGRSLQVELKTTKRFQPGQKEMIDMGIWDLATTFDEFQDILFGWEQGVLK